MLVIGTLQAGQFVAKGTKIVGRDMPIADASHVVQGIGGVNTDRLTIEFSD